MAKRHDAICVALFFKSRLDQCIQRVLQRSEHQTLKANKYETPQEAHERISDIVEWISRGVKPPNEIEGFRTVLETSEGFDTTSHEIIDELVLRLGSPKEDMPNIDYLSRASSCEAPAFPRNA